MSDLSRTNQLHHDSSVAQPPRVYGLPIIALILRGKWVVLVSVGVALLLAGLYIFTADPVYEATASVLVGTKDHEGILPYSFDGVTPLNRINNELEILKSQSLSQTVASTLLEKKTFAVGSKERFPIIETLSEDEGKTVLASKGMVMERLKTAVEFEPMKESDVIKIVGRSRDAREAAILANVYADAYVDRNINTSRARSRALREFLESQSEAKKHLLDSVESALKRYMKASGTAALDDKTKSVVEQLSRLEATRDGIDVEMISRQKTLDAYRQELSRQEPAVARNIGESNDSYIRLLQDQLARLEVQRDAIIAQNPSLKGDQIYSNRLNEINSQVASLKQKLQDRTSDFLKAVIPSVSGEGGAGYLAQTRQRVIEQEIEISELAAKKRALSSVIADYERQFDQIPEKSIDLAKLQRARLSNERLYLLIDQKFNEAAISEKSEFGYISIMDVALVPTRPVSPNKLRILILATLLGPAVGFLIVVFRERLTATVHSPDELKSFSFTSISTIGRIAWQGVKRHQRFLTQAPSGKSVEPHLVAFHRPSSYLAESYRVLRTNIQFSSPDQPPRSILVTSANPSEGKSTTVANLAITFAQGGNQTLLVDADLRRPILHRFFSLPRAPGLSEYVRGSAFDDVVESQVLPNLDVVFSGRTSANGAEVWNPNRMAEFIKLVIQRYDLVLLDSAPLLAAADAAVLAATVDTTILVVSSSQTSVPEIERALATLPSVGRKAVAVVLNNFDPQRAYGYFGPYRRSNYGYDYGESTARPSRRRLRKLQA